MKAPQPAVRLPFRRGSVEFCVGSEADHEAVYQTLLHVFHGPDRDSFLGALSDPSYRPDQRLLVKVDGRVVSHVHLTERPIRYGSVADPAQRRDVGGDAAGVSRPGVRAEPDPAGRRPRRETGAVAPGADHRHAAVLSPAGLGGLRPAEPGQGPEPEPAADRRRRGRGARAASGTSGPGGRSS